MAGRAAARSSTNFRRTQARFSPHSCLEASCWGSSRKGLIFMVTDERIAARNQGLRRVSKLTTWAVGGGLVLSGGFAALAQQAFAGQNTSKKLALGNASQRPTRVVKLNPKNSPLPQDAPTDPTAAPKRPAGPLMASTMAPKTATTHRQTTTRHPLTSGTTRNAHTTQPIYRTYITYPPQPPVVSGGS